MCSLQTVSILSIFCKKNNEKKIELPETLLDFVTIFLGGGWAIFFIKIPSHVVVKKFIVWKDAKINNLTLQVFPLEIFGKN